jgi:hypothetical protein
MESWNPLMDAEYWIRKGNGDFLEVGDERLADRYTSYVASNDVVNEKDILLAKYYNLWRLMTSDDH